MCYSSFSELYIFYNIYFIKYLFEMDYPDFYFVRHAQSLHNQRATLVKSKYNLDQNDDISGYPEYRQVKYGENYFDCDITQSGYKEQCLRSKKQCQNLDIDLVIVSPLRRALVTCYQTFKDHKNKPRVIVEPLLGERITSACDLGSKIRESIKMFPAYDFTAITEKGIQDTWYIENLPKGKREKIYEQIKLRNAKNGHQIGKIVLEFLEKEKSLETVKQLSVRIETIKRKLSQMKSKLNKTIAIVGHSNMIKTLTASGYKEDGKPINGVMLKNCQVRLINLVIKK